MLSTETNRKRQFQETEHSSKKQQLLTFKDLDLEKATMPEDWFMMLSSTLNSEYFQQLKAKLYAQKSIIYPPIDKIYSFMGCPLDRVKVIIIGQDPYHGPGQAHGLCFSVERGVKIPPSLVNIYKELKSDVGFKIPKHGYLEEWVSQGVLLLNATLTVEKGKANSHSKFGWQRFTDALVEYFNKQSHLVFLLWGGFAQKKCSNLDNSKHLVLKATHPSPLGATKGGWFGCKHFSKTNEYLKSNGKEPINWQISD